MCAVGWRTGGSDSSSFWIEKKYRKIVPAHTHSIRSQLKGFQKAICSAAQASESTHWRFYWLVICSRTHPFSIAIPEFTEFGRPANAISN